MRLAFLVLSRVSLETSSGLSSVSPAGESVGKIVWWTDSKPIGGSRLPCRRNADGPFRIRRRSCPDPGRVYHSLSSRARSITGSWNLIAGESRMPRQRGEGEDESGKVPSGAFFRFQDNSFRQGIRSREGRSGCDRNQKLTTEVLLREGRTLPLPRQDRKLQGTIGKPGKGRLDPFPVVEVPGLRRSPASCPGTSSPGTSFPDPSCPGPSCPWAWGAVEEKTHGRVVRE